LFVPSWHHSFPCWAELPAIWLPMPTRVSGGWSHMRRCLSSIKLTIGTVSLYHSPSATFLILWNISLLIVFYFAPDIDECNAHTACQCDGCSCKNKWGEYECKCKGNLIYIKEQDACIGKRNNLRLKFLDDLFFCRRC
jgi:hypothetical protein